MYFFWWAIVCNAFRMHYLFYATDGLQVKLLFCIFRRFFIFRKLFFRIFGITLSFNAYVYPLRDLVNNKTSFDGSRETGNCRSTLINVKSNYIKKIYALLCLEWTIHSSQRYSSAIDKSSLIFQIQNFCFVRK